MKLGILGLPGAGKSTLFNLLTESFDGPDYSAAANKPRIKSVKVRDPRLDRLEQDYKPKKVTPASFELYDFPAVAGEGKPGGLADLLAPARGLNALFIVLRGFDAPGGPPPDGGSDLSEVLGEFILADLVSVERRLERLSEKSRKPNFNDDDRKEQELLGRIQKSLEDDTPLASVELNADERKRLSGFGFLSEKPLVVVLNRGDKDATSTEVPPDSGDYSVATVSARNELEILELPEEERQVFLKEYGIEELSRDSLVADGYRAGGLISFFTAGEKEVRAWTIRKGETAVEAAEEIHTDIARGFIRAEVVGYEDYLACKGIKGAKEKGLFRLEGKEYVMQDGDVVEFRFSV